MNRRTSTEPRTRSFALERFAWGAPDRLELAGRFSGLEDAPAGPPVLVLSGAERTHRLPAAVGDVSGTPENGQSWSAAFVWQEPPAAFETAVLRLGSDLAIELPEPGENGDGPGNVELPVRSEPGQVADRLRLEAELLAGREELRAASAALRRAEEELARAREDLRAEREERGADAIRFRDGLAQMRAAAEEELAARDGELADARAELEVAIAFRAAAEESSKEELARLKERMTEARRRLESVTEALG